MWVLAALSALLLLLTIDLFGPRRTDIRVFDPVEVARLDTAMWRSYYDKKPLPLFFQLAELLRDQFGFPPARSLLASSYAARAAFVFKRGRSRADYELAIPDLIRYYQAIHDISVTPFDVKRTAELELEWWIVHRARLGQGGVPLEQSLAVAAAELYGAPVDRMDVYAAERRVAMDIRDTKAAAGGVTDADWREIERHLVASWTALSRAIQPGS